MSDNEEPKLKPTHRTTEGATPNPPVDSAPQVPSPTETFEAYSDDELLAASNEVIKKNNEEIVTYFHFHVMRSSLTKHGLLPGPPNELPSSSLPIDTQREIEIVQRWLTWLPSCGKPRYLPLIISSLRETKSLDEARSHKELAGILEKALQKELANPTPRNPVTPPSGVLNGRTTVGGSGATNMGAGLPVQENGPGACTGNLRRCCSWRWLSCYTFTLFLLALALVSVITLAFYPSRNVTHVTPSLLHLNDVTELKFTLPHFWVSSGTFSYPREFCNGTPSVHVFRGVSCDQVNITSVEMVNPRASNLLPVYYLLPGSSIDIFDISDIKGDDSNINTTSVWITTTSEAYARVTSIGSDLERADSCTEPMPFPNTYCYRIRDFIGQNISFQVNQSALYRVFNGCRKRCIYDAYSLTVSRVHYDLTLLPLQSSEMTSSYNFFQAAVSELVGLIDFVLMEQWSFSSQNCVLMQSDCMPIPGGAGQLQTRLNSSINRRLDIVLFPGIVLIFAAIIASLVVLVHCVNVLRPGYEQGDH